LKTMTQKITPKLLKNIIHFYLPGWRKL
jgi:hypothetical protein